MSKSISVADALLAALRAREHSPLNWNLFFWFGRHFPEPLTPTEMCEIFIELMDRGDATVNFNGSIGFRSPEGSNLNSVSLSEATIRVWQTKWKGSSQDIFVGVAMKHLEQQGIIPALPEDEK